MEALSLCRRWRGYAHDLEGSQKPIFCLREPSNSCLWMKNPITISVTSNEYRGFRDFEIRGDFTNRNCSIVDSSGRIAAQVFHTGYFIFEMNLLYIISESDST